jgi:hypothetical protein
MYFDVDGYDDDSDYMMNWGAGAKYFISNDTALRMDLRHVLDFHSDREWDRTSGDDLDNNFLASAGTIGQRRRRYPRSSRQVSRHTTGRYG